MTQRVETPAVPAGTVIVLDAQAGTVLLLRRRDSLRFMGGFWAFPGGAVDDEDVAHAPAGASAVAAAARAACRELREEAGLRLEPAALAHWAHWITPSAGSRRFDTHFFLALRPPAQAAWLASPESSELRWAEPAWVAGGPDDFPVTAPTRVELRELAMLLRDAGSTDVLLARARRREIRTVLPKISGSEAVMPWDSDYPNLPGAGVAWDAAACVDRAGCPSRWPAVVPTGQ